MQNVHLQVQAIPAPPASPDALREHLGRLVHAACLLSRHLSHRQPQPPREPVPVLLSPAPARAPPVFLLGGAVQLTWQAELL